MSRWLSVHNSTLINEMHVVKKWCWLIILKLLHVNRYSNGFGVSIATKNATTFLMEKLTALTPPWWEEYPHVLYAQLWHWHDKMIATYKMIDDGLQMLCITATEPREPCLAFHNDGSMYFSCQTPACTSISVCVGACTCINAYMACEHYSYL